MSADSEQMAIEYVQLRSDGVGSREAAREAGFSGGVPSPSARRLWDAYQYVQKADHEQLAGVLEEIDRLKLRLRRLKRRRLAMTIAASGPGV